MDRVEVVGSALVGLYLGGVVVTALRSGAIRDHTRVHPRAEEPWTDTFAVVRGEELFFS